MDISGGGYDSGTDIWLYDYNSTYAQYYNIEKCNVSYKIQFDAIGGNTSVTSKTVTYNERYGELPTPTRAGYKFTGQYTEKDGGTQITASTTVTTTSNHILYAHWDKIPVTTTTTIKPVTTTTTKTTTTKPVITTTTTIKPVTTTSTVVTNLKAPQIIPKELTINVGETETLYLLNCENIDSVTWISSNKNIAAVDNGKVTGISDGTVTIYAIVNGVYCECTVNVKKPGNDVVKGDVTENGSIDIADVVAVASYVTDSQNNPLNDKAIITGDVHNTGDGITGNDVLMIQQYIANIITDF